MLSNVYLISDIIKAWTGPNQGYMYQVAPKIAIDAVRKGRGDSWTI